MKKTVDPSVDGLSWLRVGGPSNAVRDHALSTNMMVMKQYAIEDRSNVISLADSFLTHRTLPFPFNRLLTA